MSNLEFTITNAFVEELCRNDIFVDHIQQILHQESKSATRCNHNILKIQDPLANSQDQQNLVQYENTLNSISQLLIQNLRETIHKESNQLYSQILTMMSQIQNIKQSLSVSIDCSKKTELQNGKKLISPQRLSGNEKQYTTRTKSGADTSMFLDIESQIESYSKKNFDTNSLSFIQSFCDQNQQQRVNKQDQINEKINSSISKVQSSMEEKYSNIEKNLERRIEQVMKTVKNLIALMEENNHFCRLESNQNKKQDQCCQQKVRVHALPEDTLEFKTPTKSINSNNKQKTQKSGSFLNKSQSRLSSFFKRSS